MKVALGAQVADGQSQNGEPVQLGQDAGLERQQAGQRVQLGVEALPVALTRVALARALLRRRLQAANQAKFHLNRNFETRAPELKMRSDFSHPCLFCSVCRRQHFTPEQI